MIRPLPAVLFLLLSAAAAHAQTTLQIDLGWDGAYRPGQWTPLFLTVGDTRPRQVTAEVYVPTGGPSAMRIQQSFVIGPETPTYAVYAPLPEEYWLSQCTVTLRDARSGRRLQWTAFRDQYGAPGGAVGMVRAAGAGAMMIGISGRISDANQLVGQLAGQEVVCGTLRPQRLPAASVGYSDLDLLILSAPDLAQMDSDQQQAIADWVRGGGNLVLWPSEDALPAAGPLVSILPAQVGENIVLEVPVHLLDAHGLAQRYGRLRGRRLAPLARAEPVSLFGDGGPQAYRGSAGYGQVLLLPADIASLHFKDTQAAYGFWRPLLSGLGELPAASPEAYADRFRPRLEQYGSEARFAAMNWLGNVPGAGSFGFGWVATALLGMIVLVGPVDWVVLKRLNRQPWTWLTTSLCIAVVTLAALSAGYLLKSGDLHYRSLRLIDEVGGASVGTVDMLAMYSPRTQDYALSYDPASWWRPSTGQRYYHSGTPNQELISHQDYRGTRPTDELRIGIWNTTFLEATNAEQKPALIEAQLQVKGDRVVGTLANRSGSTLKDLHIRTPWGTAHLGAQRIAPGQTLAVDRPLARGWLAPISEAATQPTYRSWPMTGDRPTASSVGGLEVRRSLRIDALIDKPPEDSAGAMAVVYAELDTPTPPAGLDDPAAIQQHLCIVRSLVELR